MRQFFLAIAFLFSACCQGLSQTQTAFDLRGKTQTLHVYGSGPKGSIILSSGDLGWAGLVVHVAESLSSQGYRVIGFDSRTYLSSFTSKNSVLSPQDVPRDFKCLIDFVSREGQPETGSGWSLRGCRAFCACSDRTGDPAKHSRGARAGLAEPKRAGLAMAGLYHLAHKEGPQRTNLPGGEDHPWSCSGSPGRDSFHA